MSKISIRSLKMTILLLDIFTVSFCRLDMILKIQRLSNHKVEKSNGIQKYHLQSVI